MEKDILLTTQQEFDLSNTSFLYLKMLASRCGIDLKEYKRNLFYNRLYKRIRFLNLESIDEYCNLLRIDIEEELKFINLLTNPTTYFFREPHHFENLAKIFIPELLAHTNKIRIWSAGCSTGEEAYSIAIVLHETITNINNYDIKILATDINSESLNKAENGLYDCDEIEKISHLRQKIWFDKVNTAHGEFFQVSKKLKDLITFNQLNLMDPWPIKSTFDIIFSRNVLIYFQKDIIDIIIRKFYSLLNDNGILILGHSETLDENKFNLKNIGTTTYRKIS